VVVGGLRLATRSLEELRKDSDLTGDSKLDAYRLAALLRETLGTAELVPADKPKQPRPAPRPRQATPPLPAPTGVAPPALTGVAPPAAAPSGARAGGGNPFGAPK